MNIYYLTFEEILIPEEVPDKYFKMIEKDSSELIKELISRLSSRLKYKIVKLSDDTIYMESTRYNQVDLGVIDDTLQEVLIDFEKYIQNKYESDEIIIYCNIRFDKLAEA